MKKKMAIVLSAVLALTMGMTVAAAPSPTIQNEPVAQVVVSPTAGTTASGTAATTSVASEKSAVLPGTTFTTASGQVVDPAAVALTTAPTSAEQATTAAASLAAALVSPSMKVVNFTGTKNLSLTDTQGNLNVVNNMTVALTTATGETVSQNGSISAAFVLTEILGGTALAEGETLQALYQRADGTWVAVPVVIANGAVAIALPAFGGAVNVTFIVAKGTPMSEIPAAAATSPRT